MVDTAPGSGDDLSEKQLKWAVWWVEHKVQLKKIFTVTLAIVAFSLFSFGTWGFADWFFGSGVNERAGIALLTQNLTDYEGFRVANQPQSAVIQTPLVLVSGENRYDIVVKVSNPNHRWWLELDYRFKGPSVPTEVQTAFVLPTDTRYVYALGIKADSKPTAALEVVKMQWHRVDGHEVQPEYLTWAKERLNFAISNPTFSPPETNSSLPVSRAGFSVENDTAFSFVSVPFFVTLLSGSRVVGVNRVVSTRFLSGETRQVEASWFHDLPSVTKVEVTPELNIFDDRVFLKPGE
ncbi:MAG: hypothetical protein V1738_03900 [Patescibacteria group bacterium]